MAASLLLFFPTTTQAHTYLNDSNPQAGADVGQPVKEIILYFDTKVEPQSTFEVVDEAGEVYQTSSTNIEKNVMSGTMTERLTTGTYTVNWDIIGADGHLIQGSFSFDVHADQPRPEQEANGEAQGENRSTSVEHTRSEEQDGTEIDEEKHAESLESDSTDTKTLSQNASSHAHQEQSFPFITMMSIIVLLGGSSFWYVSRRSNG